MADYQYLDLSLDQEVREIESALRMDEMSGMDSLGADTLVEVVMSEAEQARDPRDLLKGMYNDLQSSAMGLRVDGVYSAWNDIATSGLGFAPPRSLWSMAERKIADPNEDRERIEVLVGLGYLDHSALSDPRWRPEYNVIDSQARRDYQEARFSGAAAFGLPMFTPNDRIREDAGGLTKAFGSATEVLDKYVSPLGRLEAMLLAEVVPDFGAWLDDDKSMWEKIGGTVLPLVNVALFAVGVGQAGIALRLATAVARGRGAARVAGAAGQVSRLQVDDALFAGRNKFFGRLGEKGMQARLDARLGKGHANAKLSGEQIAEGLVGKGFLAGKLLARDSKWLHSAGRVLDRTRLSAPSIAAKGIGQATFVPGIVTRVQEESGPDTDDGLSVSDISPVGSSIGWLRNRESWEANLVSLPLEIVMEPARVLQPGVVKGVAGRASVWFQRAVREDLGSSLDTALGITDMSGALAAFARRQADEGAQRIALDLANEVRVMQATGVNQAEVLRYIGHGTLPGEVDEAADLATLAQLKMFAEDAGMEELARVRMAEAGRDPSDRADFLIWRNQIFNEARHVFPGDYEAMVRAQAWATAKSPDDFYQKVAQIHDELAKSGDEGIQRAVAAHNEHVEDVMSVVASHVRPDLVAQKIEGFLRMRGPFRPHEQYAADSRVLRAADLSEAKFRRSGFAPQIGDAKVGDGSKVWEKPMLSKLGEYDEEMKAFAAGDERLLESIRTGAVVAVPVRPHEHAVPMLMDIATPARQEYQEAASGVRQLQTRSNLFRELAEENEEPLAELLRRARGVYKEGELAGDVTEAGAVSAAIARWKGAVKQPVIRAAVKEGLRARPVNAPEVVKVFESAGEFIGARQAQVIADIMNMDEIAGARTVGSAMTKLETAYTTRVADTDWDAFGVAAPPTMDDVPAALAQMDEKSKMVGWQVDPDTLPDELKAMEDRWKVVYSSDGRYEDEYGQFEQFNEAKALFDQVETQRNLGLFMSADARHAKMQTVFAVAKKAGRGLYRKEAPLVAQVNKASRANSVMRAWHSRFGEWMSEEQVEVATDMVDRLMTSVFEHARYMTEIERPSKSLLGKVGTNLELGRLARSPQDLTRNPKIAEIAAKAWEAGEVTPEMLPGLGSVIKLPVKWNADQIAAVFDGLRKSRDVGWDYRGFSTVFDKMSATPVMRNQLRNMASYESEFAKELGRSEVVRTAATAASAGAAAVAAHELGAGFDPDDPFSFDSLQVLASGVAGAVVGRSLSGRKLRQVYEDSNPLSGLDTAPPWMGADSALIGKAARVARSPGVLAAAGGVGGGLATDEGAGGGAFKGAITGALVGAGAGAPSKADGALGLFGKGQRSLGSRADALDAAVTGHRALDQYTRINWNSWSYLPERLRGLVQFWRYSASPWFSAQQFSEAFMLKQMVQTGEILDDIPGGLRMSVLPGRYERQVARDFRKKGMGEADAGRAAKELVSEDKDAFAAQMRRRTDFDYDALEEGSRRFADTSLFGYSVPQMEMTLFSQMRRAGMSDAKAYDIASKTYTYGVNPRGAVEQSVNTVWFPASFQLKAARHAVDWLADDMRRTVLFHNAVRLFSQANERYDIEGIIADRAPVIEKLFDLNIFASGFGIGVFGGEYRNFARAVSALPFSPLVNKALTLTAGPVGITVDNPAGWDEVQRDLAKLLPFYTQLKFAQQDVSDTFTAQLSSKSGLTPRAEWERGFDESWRIKRLMDTILKLDYGEADGLTAIRKPQYQTLAIFYDTKMAAIRDKYPGWARSAGNSAQRAILRGNEAERLKTVAVEESSKPFGERSVEGQMGSLLGLYEEQVELYGTWLDVPLPVVDAYRRRAAEFVNRGGPQAEVMYGQHLQRIVGPLFDVTVRTRR